MEMPKSIKLFEQLFLGSLVLGFIQLALMRGVFVFEIIVLLITGSLVLLTSRKKSLICKWIITVLFALGFILGFATSAVWQEGISSVIFVVQTLMQAYAVYLLFQSDSEAWFDESKDKA